jgi:hypothetical protein
MLTEKCNDEAHSDFATDHNSSNRRRLEYRAILFYQMRDEDTQHLTDLRRRLSGIAQFENSIPVPGVDPNENKHGQNAAIDSLVLNRFFLSRNTTAIVKKS